MLITKIAAGVTVETQKDQKTGKHHTYYVNCGVVNRENFENHQEAVDMATEYHADARQNKCMGDPLAYIKGAANA